MAWFCGIGELEGGDAVLENVGPGQETSFFADDVSDILDAAAIVFDAVDVAEPFEVPLLVGDLARWIDFARLAEGEAALGDIFAREVV